MGQGRHRRRQEPGQPEDLLTLTLRAVVDTLPPHFDCAHHMAPHMARNLGKQFSAFQFVIDKLQVSIERNDVAPSSCAIRSA